MFASSEGHPAGAAGLGRIRRSAGACAVAVALLMQGCAAFNIGYEAQTSVWPSGKPGEYIVTFNIFENLVAGGERLVSSPRLKVKDGCEGQVTLGDKRSSMKCSALVKSGSQGTAATIRVRIKQGDKKVWTTRQTVMFSAHSQDQQADEGVDSSDEPGKE